MTDNINAPNRGASGRSLKGPFQDPNELDAPASDTSRAPSVASLFGDMGGLDVDFDFGSLGFTTDSTVSVDTRPTRKSTFLKVRAEGNSSDSNNLKAKKVKAKGVKNPKVTAGATHDVALLERAAGCSPAPPRRKSLLTMSYAKYSKEELGQMPHEDEALILQIAEKPPGSKGCTLKSFKCRATSMRNIILELIQRPTTESQQLQAEVGQMQAEISQLRSKLAEITARPAQAGQGTAVEAPSNLEEIIRKVVLEERACLAGIDDRLLPETLLRPSLAADKNRGLVLPSQRETATGPSSQKQPTPGPSFQREPTPVPSSQREDPLLPATTLSNPWTTVVRKSKRKKAAAASTPAPSRPPQESGKGKGVGKRSAPKPPTAASAAKGAHAGARKRLAPPKTAAVMVTLTTEAAERGETYLSILKRARTNADPFQLGIEKVTCRRTQTGARIFEFSGAQGGTNADLFAAKLQEVIADSAKVVRPVRTAVLEVADLDDSVTREEVVAKVAAMGGCDVTAVKGRDIRPGRGGMGTMRVECPIAAAEAVLSKGRLLIGLSSSVVRALGKQPLRCYKCFVIGHTRALCPSSIDRSDCCYRCGQERHKSASCKASIPRCAVCTASCLPADHVMKGRKCNPPPKKGKTQVSTWANAPTAVPGAPAAAEGNTMSN